nr:FG-GAP repeat protein [Pseudomonadota bacterium]
NASGIDGIQGDNSASFAGAVYVFSRTGSVWSQQAYVKASNSENSDLFGAAVSLSAGGDTLAVGAPGEEGNAVGIDGNQFDNSATRAGAVYVFSRAGSVWSQQAYVKTSNSEVSDFFGETLSLSADGNTLAVGASGEASNATGIDGNQDDNTAALAGAVYVFSRTGGAWSQQAYVKASNSGADDFFGDVVSLSADGNTLAVGAFGEDGNAIGIDGNQGDNTADSAGAVYVFSRTGGAWSQEAYVKASNSEAGDFFGRAVSLSTEGNALAIGAWSEDSNATGIDGNQFDNTANDAGAVYMFGRAGGTWSQRAYLKASNTEAGDVYGSLGISLSADGNTLAVGAFGEASNATGIDGNQGDNSAADAGAVYLY